MTASNALPSRPPSGLDVAIDFTHRTLRPCGDIDMGSVMVLIEAADALVVRTVGDLTIDCAEITFADSALLLALLVIGADVRGRGATLTLVNKSPCVRRLLLASGFRTDFTGSSRPAWQTSRGSE